MRRLRENPVPRRHPTQRLTPEQCFHAADECGAPIIAIPGGEPLLHPEIEEIVSGSSPAKNIVYLCTNAILLGRGICTGSRRRNICRFQSSTTARRRNARRSRLPGGSLRRRRPCDQGRAKQAGFRVTTNSTILQHRRSGPHAAMLRHADGPRCRRDDDLARLSILKKPPARNYSCIVKKR